MPSGLPHVNLTRRRALASLGGAAVLAGGLYGLRQVQGDSAAAAYPTAPQPPAGADILGITLTAKERRLQLADQPTPVWSYGEDGGLPVIRLDRKSVV